MSQVQRAIPLAEVRYKNGKSVSHFRLEEARLGLEHIECSATLRNWSRYILEKPTLPQQVKERPEFHGT
jgi:hypothetical protein